MRDIVIVPSHYRAEFVYLCLEHLAVADGGKYKEVYVFQDVHANDKPEQFGLLRDVKAAVDLWQRTFEHLQYVERRPHNFPKNPFNFLEAYKDAYGADDVRYVYLVEDDVMVAKDFFQWHEAVMEKEDPFISVGWHCIRNHDIPRSEDPNGYVRSFRDFSSIGICWKRENLAPLVRHATPAYYSDMAGYLGKAFPDSPIPAGQWTEQAGIITRLLHEKPGERKVVWPARSRVGHVGIRGYHRSNGHKFIGSLEKRINDLRRAITSTETLKRLGAGCEDVNQVPDVLPWKPEDLYCWREVLYEKGKI